MNQGVYGLPGRERDDSWILPVMLPRDPRVGTSAFQPLTRAATTMSSKSMGGTTYLWFTPARFLRDIYLQDVTIEVTTSAASTTIVLSLYEIGEDGLPSKLFCPALATFDPTSTGVKTVTVGKQLPKRGMYWAAQAVGSNTPFCRGWTLSGYFEHAYAPQTDTVSSAGRGSLAARITAGETPADVSGHFLRAYGTNPGWELGNGNPFISLRGWSL